MTDEAEATTTTAPEPAEQGAEPQTAAPDTTTQDQADEPAPAVLLRYIGDGSVFQSNIPNRDVTEADQLSEELLQLAVDTGTHERV